MPRNVLSEKQSAPRRSPLAERLSQTLGAGDGIRAGERIGVGVSGGADSVALLLLLLELREKLGIVISVVHFNHQLRGKASDSDEKFVARLAARHKLAFHVKQEEVRRKAQRERSNLEEAARQSRYAYFERLVAEGQLDRVVIAHTADDQAETVLAHIFRGTGLAGLAGIHPHAGVVFRPLLGLRRDELRAYLRSRRQTWREDQTNRDTRRTRSRIRYKLLPLLEKQFQPAVVAHLCQLAELARGEDAWLDRAAEQRLKQIATDAGGGLRLAVGELTGQPERRQKATLTGAAIPASSLALARRIVRLIVKRVKPRAGQLSNVHVEAVLRLAREAETGKSLRLPGGVEVVRERDSLCFLPAGQLPSSGRGSLRPKGYAYRVALVGGRAELRVVEHSCALRFTVIDWPPEGRETNRGGVVLDLQRLTGPLLVRNWRPGDRLQPLGHQRRHKVSRLLNQAGIGRAEKATWPVLVCGEEIVWASGLAVAAAYAPGDATRSGLWIGEERLS